MADQTQSPPSQPGIAVTGLTYPTTLTGSPYQQDAPILELNTAGASVELVIGSGGGEGDTAPPTTGQIWPRGLC